MVSYFNHMAMYRQQASVVPPQAQFHQSGTPPGSWYPYGAHHTPPQHQQYFNCMQEGPSEQHTAWHHGVFGHQEMFEQYQIPYGGQRSLAVDAASEPAEILPSPPISSSELSSPGAAGNVTPPQHGACRPPPVRSPYDWITKPSYQSQPNPGKTRTKDKYRVVYTDHQRLELEKEFHFSRYITIRRKAELAANLGLSERQVKIWFQNRRAKERKQVKKREELNQKDGIINNQQCVSANSAVTAIQQLHQQSLLHHHHQQQMNNLPVSLPLM